MFLIGDTQRSISSTAVGSSVRSAGEPLPLVAVGEQLVGAAGDHVAGGLVAADEDEQRLVDERVVVEPVAVDLGVHEHAHEVVVRLAPDGPRRGWSAYSL